MDIPQFAYPFTCWKVVSSFWLLQIKLLWKSTYKSLPGHMLLFLLGNYPRMKWLDHWVDIYLIFKETAKQLSKVLVLFYNPTSSLGELQFLHILINTWFNLLVIFYSFHPSRSIEVFHCGLYLHLPNSKWYSTSFCVLVIHIASLLKCLFKSFAHLLIRFSHIIDLRAFVIFWKQILYWICHLEIFSPNLWFIFSLS